MNRAQAKRLAPLLDPIKPAEPELHVERPLPPLDRLREAWALGLDEPKHCLLLGAMGSGKSTELHYLAKAMARDEVWTEDRPVVALLRLQDQLETRQVTAAQVLFLLGVASLTLVDEPPRKLVNELERAYAAIIEDGANDDVDVNALINNLAMLVGGAAKAAGRPLLGALLGGLGGVTRDAPQLSLPGKGLHLQANQTPVIKLATAVNEAIDWTRSAFARAPLVIFVDGLDRLDPSSVDELFGSSVLSMPHCPVVYSAPLALRYDIEGLPLQPRYEILTVHNFPIYQPHDPTRPNPAGYASMRELLRRRLEASQLAPEAVFTDGLDPGGVVDRAIAASGGVTQTFLWLLDRSLRRALVRAGGAEFVIDDAVLATVIDDAGKDLANRVRRSQYAILREVQTSFARPEGEGADQLLYYNVVLNYPNNPAWFWPSPLLEPYLVAVEASS